MRNNHTFILTLLSTRVDKMAATEDLQHKVTGQWGDRDSLKKKGTTNRGTDEAA